MLSDVTPWFLQIGNHARSLRESNLCKLQTKPFSISCSKGLDIFLKDRKSKVLDMGLICQNLRFYEDQIKGKN